MSNHRANSVDRFSGRGFQAGMAKDQLIFVIICSAALLVAAVTLVHFFTGASKKATPTAPWQCLKCDREFSIKTLELPPIECPECGGDAVRVRYRKCPSCGAKVPCYRLRLPEGRKAQLDAMKKHAESTGQPVAPGPMMDMEIQYRVKQADGSYAWTDWLNPRGSPQLAAQLQKNMRCSECEALLFSRSSRSGRSGN